MPSPHRPEAVKESNILEEVRVEPESRRHRKVCDSEENETKNAHGEEETNQTQHTHAEVPHTETQLHRPEREHDDSEDDGERTRSIQLRHDLRALVQPDEVQLIAALLLLLDLDRPQPLDALALGGGRVVVALVRVNLGDAQGEEGEREELEDVFKGGAVGDRGEEGVLRAGLLVGWALEGAEGALDCVGVSGGFEGDTGWMGLPLNMSLRWSFKIHVLGFRSWLLRNLATAMAAGLGGPGVIGCGP